MKSDIHFNQANMYTIPFAIYDPEFTHTIEEEDYNCNLSLGIGNTLSLGFMDRNWHNLRFDPNPQPMFYEVVKGIIITELTKERIIRATKRGDLRPLNIQQFVPGAFYEKGDIVFGTWFDIFICTKAGTYFTINTNQIDVEFPYATEEEPGLQPIESVALINEIDDSVNDLEYVIDELQKDIAQHSTDIAGINGRVDDNKEHIKSAHDHIDRQELNINDIEHRVVLLQNEASELRHDMTSLRTQVEYIEPRISGIELKINELESAIITYQPNIPQQIGKMYFGGWDQPLYRMFLEFTSSYIHNALWASQTTTNVAIYHAHINNTLDSFEYKLAIDPVSIILPYPFLMLLSSQLNIQYSGIYGSAIIPSSKIIDSRDGIGMEGSLSIEFCPWATSMTIGFIADTPEIMKKFLDSSLFGFIEYC
jgi:hypothetical protein